MPRNSNKDHIVSVYVCSLRHPSCNAHAPYCHLCPAPLYNIFPTFSHKRHDFREKVTENKMCVLIFCTTFVWNISHSEKNLARYDKNCISVCMYSTGYCWQIVLKLEFPHYLINGTIFGKKLLNTKRVFWFSVHLLSETCLILRRTEWDMIKNVYRSACNVPVIVGRL